MTPTDTTLDTPKGDTTLPETPPGGAAAPPDPTADPKGWQSDLDQLRSRLEQLRQELQAEVEKATDQIARLDQALQGADQYTGATASTRAKPQDPGASRPAAPTWIEARINELWEGRKLDAEADRLKESQTSAAAYATERKGVVDAVNTEIEGYGPEQKDLSGKSAEAKRELEKLATRLKRINEELFNNVTANYLDAYSTALTAWKGKLTAAEVALVTAEAEKAEADATAEGARANLDELKGRRDRTKTLTGDLEKALKAADAAADADRYAEAIVQARLAQDQAKDAPALPPLDEFQQTLSAARDAFLAKRLAQLDAGLAVFGKKRRRDDLQALLKELEDKRLEWLMKHVATLETPEAPA